MSVYGDDHDGHVCERCDREYLLRDDAEPTRWCDECAQIIASDLTARLAAAEAERDSERSTRLSFESRLRTATESGTPYAADRDAMNALVVANQQLEDRLAEAEAERDECRSDLASTVADLKVAHDCKAIAETAAFFLLEVCKHTDEVRYEQALKHWPFLKEAKA